MVGVRFSRFAEEKSAELADSLVSKLMESPRTTAYRELDRDALLNECREFFQGLTDWLIYRGVADIEEYYRRKGKRRASQGVPLEQCVNAMLVCRDHLVQYLRHEAHWGHNEELFGELEFVVAVNHFFDDAIFFQMRGHREHATSVEEVA
jgi:hypothetical protein